MIICSMPACQTTAGCICDRVSHLVAPQLKCNGIGRDADHDRALCFYFNRRPTDDEMRYLHEVMERAVACMVLPIVETDWPPAASAIGLAEGVRRHGSTGQCFEVKQGRWERVR